MLLRTSGQVLHTGKSPGTLSSVAVIGHALLTALGILGIGDPKI